MGYISCHLNLTWFISLCKFGFMTFSIFCLPYDFSDMLNCLYNTSGSNTFLAPDKVGVLHNEMNSWYQVNFIHMQSNSDNDVKCLISAFIIFTLQ